MRILDKISYYIGKFCSWIAAFFVLCLMIEVIADVVLRKVMQFTIRGGFEYATFFMAILVFFSLAYTQQQRGMIHVTILFVKLRGKLRFLVWGIGMLLAAAMALFFAYGSFMHGILIKNLGTTSATLTVPYWPFYFLGAFTFTLYGLVMCIDTIKTFYALSNEEYAREVSANWVS